ncbi:MAG TPA: patatin-like phospholipase family protein [Candidatus Angelobacter sp.]
MSPEKKTFRDKLKAAPQKKLLALDGGGIRGVITLEILAKIEQMLREKSGNSALVLSDYFDYLAGTSTGAIIAACLAKGMAVAGVTKFYHESGHAMFTRAGILKRFRYKFADDALSKKLQDVLGANTTLGSDDLQTLLMLVMRNATTDSHWPVSNNPSAKYNDPLLDDCNLHIPLWQLVRASTAAPTYFPPELVHIGKKDFLFVDGGMTMYNNPAFQLFLMATVEPYNLKWATGVDKMLVVSVGTGTSPKANANLQADEMNLLYNAGSIPSALMFAALNEQDFLCRVFGDCRVGCKLDSEIGDMKAKAGPAVPKLFTYLRYNAELTDEGLRQLHLVDIKPEHVQALDSVDHIAEMQQVGQAVAKHEVQKEHFAGF